MLPALAPLDHQVQAGRIGPVACRRIHHNGMLPRAAVSACVSCVQLACPAAGVACPCLSGWPATSRRKRGCLERSKARQPGHTLQRRETVAIGVLNTRAAGFCQPSSQLPGSEGSGMSGGCAPRNTAPTLGVHPTLRRAALGAWRAASGRRLCINGSATAQTTQQAAAPHPTPVLVYAKRAGALSKLLDHARPHAWPSPAVAPRATRVEHAGWHGKANLATRSACEAASVFYFFKRLAQGWVARPPHARSTRPKRRSRKSLARDRLRTRLGIPAPWR